MHRVVPWRPQCCCRIASDARPVDSCCLVVPSRRHVRHEADRCLFFYLCCLCRLTVHCSASREVEVDNHLAWSCVCAAILTNGAMSCEKLLHLALQCGHVNHGVGAHSVFCYPHCGLIADWDTQAAKNILGHGLSVLRELDLDLYKQCIRGTSLAGGADGCCIPARA